MAPEFLHKKLTEVLMNVDPLHNDVFFYPLLVSFHLPIAYKKVKNLENSVDRLVGKVLIHVQCITSHKVCKCLHNQHNY